VSQHEPTYESFDAWDAAGQPPRDAYKQYIEDKHAREAPPVVKTPTPRMTPDEREQYIANNKRMGSPLKVHPKVKVPARIGGPFGWDPYFVVTLRDRMVAALWWIAVAVCVLTILVPVFFWALFPLFGFKPKTVNPFQRSIYEGEMSLEAAQAERKRCNRIGTVLVVAIAMLIIVGYAILVASWYASDAGNPWW
jgi:hypothetical protein